MIAGSTICHPHDLLSFKDQGDIFVVADSQTPTQKFHFSSVCHPPLQWPLRQLGPARSYASFHKTTQISWFSYIVQYEIVHLFGI